MKKLVIIFGVLTGMVFSAHSGGLVTNSNQSASYYRMLARGASTTGDAVYYNPAGLAFLEDGFTLSLNTQMIWMKRIINNDFPDLKRHLDSSGKLREGEFVGNLYVPVFPGIYAAYKTGNWAFSLGFNPPAGGGSIEFKEGIPMLELPVCVLPGYVTQLGIPTQNYSVNSMMKGMSIVYAVQAGVSYKINEVLALSGGVRMMFASNSYEGYLKDIKINPTIPGLLDGSMLGASDLDTKGNEFNAMADALGQDHAQYMQLKTLAGGLKQLAAGIPGNTELDVKQSGRGVAPILGLHYKKDGLNLAVKYEFKTKITLKNETSKNALNMYPDKQELRSDIPAVLSLAGSFEIVPSLRLSLTYLNHFEKQAVIESWSPDNTLPKGGTIVERQNFINSGTIEYQAGLEWMIGDKFTLSAGCQWSDVDVKETWHNDITHNLDNFTLGIGAQYKFGERLSLNLGGLNTWYTPVTIDNSVYKQTYDRENKAIALGIEYRF